MNIFTKPNLTAWPSAVLMLLCVQTVKADVSLDQLLFIDMGDGYAVRSQPETVLEGVLNIPAEYNGKPVVEIAPDGFKEQVKLTEVNVPAPVKIIEPNAFATCFALTKVHLSEGLITIADFAFANCESVAEINLPSTVETIGFQAFFRCSGINELVIPASIKHIELNAFQGCGVQKLVFPEGITRIGEDTFAGLGNLKEIQFPSTLTSIGEYAFFNNGLTEVRLPENLKYIGEKAFGFRFDIDCKLEKVIVDGTELPEGFAAAFTSADGSLARCRTITLEAPNAIQPGMNYPSGIEDFNICHNYDVLEFTLRYEGLDNEFYEVTPKEKDFSALTGGYLFIPGLHYKAGSNYSNGTYLPVRIANEAFKECKGLEYLWLSGNLKDNLYPGIESDVFKDSDLKSVEQLPDESVGDFAFYGCNTLTNVNFHEGLKTIGDVAFSGCI